MTGAVQQLDRMIRFNRIRNAGVTALETLYSPILEWLEPFLASGVDEIRVHPRMFAALAAVNELAFGPSDCAGLPGATFVTLRSIRVVENAALMPHEVAYFHEGRPCSRDDLARRDV